VELERRALSGVSAAGWRGRAQIVGAVLALGALLTGCFSYDAAPDKAQIFNDRDVAVRVQISGTELAVDLRARSGWISRDEKCVGTGVVILDAAGAELAAYDGAVCPSTVIALHSDGRIVVEDGNTVRVPIEPSPGA
jgi:hypothetical protein